VRGGNNMKTSFKLLLMVLIMAFLLTGYSDNTSQKTTLASSTQPLDLPNKTSTPPTIPIEVQVAFPDGAPPLNQTAELTCTIITHRLTMKDMNLEIVLPDGLELINGQLSWTGVPPVDGSIQIINAEVKSVELGNWIIEIPYHINPVEPGGYGGDGKRLVYVSILEDSAEWNSRYPPWKTGTPTVDTSDLPPPPVTSTKETTGDTKNLPSCNIR